MFLTSLPIIVYALFDKPISNETLMTVPQVYNKSTSLTPGAFWKARRQIVAVGCGACVVLSSWSGTAFGCPPAAASCRPMTSCLRNVWPHTSGSHVFRQSIWDSIVHSAICFFLTLYAVRCKMTAAIGTPVWCRRFLFC